MKIVFLDIDGVLNNDKYLKMRVEPYSMDNHTCFDPKSIAALAEILQKSGAKVVLSSMWRYYNTNKEMETMLELCGLRTEIIDSTSKEAYHHRGGEIKEWLDRNPHITEYVVLDDDTDVRDIECLKPRWIQTTWFKGLQKEHVEPALKILGVEING